MGKSKTMTSTQLGCLAEASCLLRIIMFLGIAYGLGNVFNDIRGETSACAQDGPPCAQYDSDSGTT